MTPGEIDALGDGLKLRDEYIMERLAWVSANLMNCWKGKGGRRITVDRLLGRRTTPTRRADASTMDQIKALVASDQVASDGRMVISEAAFAVAWERSQARAAEYRARRARSV